MGGGRHYSADLFIVYLVGFFLILISLYIVCLCEKSRPANFLSIYLSEMIRGQTATRWIFIKLLSK